MVSPDWCRGIGEQRQKGGLNPWRGASLLADVPSLRQLLLRPDLGNSATGGVEIANELFHGVAGHFSLSKIL